MKIETLNKAKQMAADVLECGATYQSAGHPYGLGRSTVERHVKALILEVARAGLLTDVEDDALSSLLRLRRIGGPVMEAVRAYRPAQSRPVPATTLSLEEIAAGAHQVRRRSDNANRDVALIYVLFCTGAKPIEIARLTVRDYLHACGAVREFSELPALATTCGRARPIFFTSARTCVAVDAYLSERSKRKLGVGPNSQFRGLDPDSKLFLTEAGEPFEIRARTCADSRQTCPVLIATFRTIFKRAGWVGVTAQMARRLVAQRLADNGADEQQVGELLGLSSARAIRRLIVHERRPLQAVVKDLV